MSWEIFASSTIRRALFPMEKEEKSALFVMTQVMETKKI